MRWLVVLLLLTACAEPLEDQSPRACCEALTAECLACSNDVSVEEYCTENPETVGCPSPEQTLPYTMLFSYENLTAYTYRADLGVVEALVTTEVEPVVSGGEPAWELTTSNTESDLVVVMTVDRETHACLGTHLEADGELIEDVCPPDGLNSRFAGSVELESLGEDMVTVLAGTYTGEKYSADGITYWLSPGVPVPVKYSGEGYTMELVSWE